MLKLFDPATIIVAKEGVSIWRRTSPGEPPVRKKQRKKVEKLKTYISPKTNMEPKNVGFGSDDFPFQTGDVQIPS